MTAPLRLAGPRVSLVPASRAVAAAVAEHRPVEPALAVLGLRAAPGWPHADSPDALRPLAEHGADGDVGTWLVVVDGETREGEWPFGDGAVFPAGPMREPLAAGLARADAVVLLLPADLEAADPALRAVFGALPVLVARLEPAAPPPPGPQFAFAGVGKPWKVERALRAAGCDLADFAPWPDHHPYAEADLRVMAGRAQALGADLLTTEKDAARLPPAWRARVGVWPVRVRFEDEAALDALLRAAVP